MELKSAEHKDIQYTLTFKDEQDGNLVEISIHFIERWKFDFDYKIAGQPVGFPFDFKKTLLSFYIHIPNQNKRYFFKSCLDYLIKETIMPVHVAQAEHPGYPLMVVTFDPKIIEKETMKKMLANILDSIESAKITIMEKSKEEEEEKDPLDEIDEENVVEFELDDEIKDFMKVPVYAEAIQNDEDEELSVYAEVVEGDSNDD